MILDPARIHRRKARPLSRFARLRRMQRQVAQRFRMAQIERAAQALSMAADGFFNPFDPSCPCPDCTAVRAAPQSPSIH